MFEKQYKLRFLPIFYNDLSSVVTYIAKDLNSPQTALKFIDKVEQTTKTAWQDMPSGFRFWLKA